MTCLPDKPSELIRAALDDLEKCEGDPEYAVKMHKWHEPDGLGGACHVCLAGAVMAQSLRAPSDTFCVPEDYPVDLEKKLDALDLFRCGYARAGVRELGLTITLSVPAEVGIENYERNAEQFKIDMRRLASQLESTGL